MYRFLRLFLKPSLSLGVITQPCGCAFERELSSQAVRIPCGSGFSREESNAVHDTGCAGARS
ncbi:MAG TPA: hypothetical protein DGQ94_07840 [Pseudomonas sp.]|nr:hypothetical protein [Pseudomonas sp.]